MTDLEKLQQKIELLELREKARNSRSARELYDIYAPRLLRILDKLIQQPFKKRGIYEKNKI